MPVKGQKNKRGTGELYGEVKRQRSIALTDPGLKGLDELAKYFGLSRSEFIEKIGRSDILVANLGLQDLEVLKSLALQRNLHLADLVRDACQVFIKSVGNSQFLNKS